MKDSNIIALLWQRSQQAISALAEAYGKLLQRICENILDSPEDAQECVNDTYLALWNTIPPNRPNPLSPFVCRTGRNIALTRLRNDTAQKRCSRYDLSLEELAGVIGEFCLDEAISARALGQAIDAFLNTQTRENRVLFLRRYWFGDPVAQIAAQLKLTPNAASVRLSRMREALKDYLEKEELYHAG